MPVGHGTHCADDALETLPGEHVVQETAAAALKVPLAHVLQVFETAAVPAGHDVHAE